jgi:uncharacterized protein YbaP (TraB family)
VVAFAVCNGSDLRDTLPPEMVAEAYARVAQIPFHDGLAFEAIRGDTRITLFGTVHVSDPAVVIPGEIADRIRDADLVLVEMAAAEQELFQHEVLDDSMLIFDFAGPGLRARLSEQQWETLSGHLSAIGTPPEIAEYLRPWFVTVLLETALCEVDARRQGARLLDERIEMLAHDLAIETAGLDDATELLAFFIDAPEETQLEVLRLSLAGVAADDDLVATAVVTWLEQQPVVVMELTRLQNRALVDDVEALDDAYQKLDHYLVLKRNRAWVGKILEHAHQASEIVVAVGAAHLPGVAGLINLLQAENFAIARVSVF